MGKIFNDAFLNQCKKITERYDKIYGSWNRDSGLLHIISEVCETKDVLRNKNFRYGHNQAYQDILLSEIADIFLTSISLTNILNISNDELNSAIEKKLEVIESRIESLGVREK